jgi:hypothetical protein
VRIIRDECDWRATWWPDWSDDEVDVDDSCSCDPNYRYFSEGRFYPCAESVGRKNFECVTIEERLVAQRKWQRC